jgi:E-phenylitaconyl-CoA hydratase
MGLIEYEHDGPVATITINRPEKRNAMTAEMHRLLSGFLCDMDGDRTVRVGVLTGAGGKAFSAGADLNEVAATRGEGEIWPTPRPDSFGSGQQVRKPLIAAIDGYCLAGGLEMALACDLRIAGASSVFGFPEVRRGLIAGYGAQVLPRLVGLADAIYLLTTGRNVDVHEARRMGLVNEVVDDGTALESAHALAETIAACSPLAVQLSKDIAIRSFERSGEESLRQIAFMHDLIRRSSDSAEGTASFLEGRSATFGGNDGG